MVGPLIQTEKLMFVNESFDESEDEGDEIMTVLGYPFFPFADS